jgi:hypothetical protein
MKMTSTNKNVLDLCVRNEAKPPHHNDGLWMAVSH